MPSESDEVEYCACETPVDTAVTATVATFDPSMLNVTVPVGEPVPPGPLTVAVKVTDAPTKDGSSLLTTVVVVDTVVAAALKAPAGQPVSALDDSVNVGVGSLLTFS